MNKISLWLAALLFAFAGAANAHIISIGYANAGPGSVTFWYGSYHDDGVGDGPDLEGALTLVGINGNPYASNTVSFTTSASSLPMGLIDGVTNFYANNSGGIQGTNILQAVNSWEGVTFTGLTAGDYHFVATPGGSAHWTAWNQAVLSNNVTLTADVVSVPEPVSISLFGLGAVALAFTRRKKNSAT